MDTNPAVILSLIADLYAGNAQALAENARLKAELVEANKSNEAMREHIANLESDMDAVKKSDAN